MNDQTLASKWQETALRNLEGKLGKVDKYILELSEKRANTLPRATEDSSRDNEKATK